MTALPWINDGATVTECKFWIAPDQFLAINTSGGEVFAGAGIGGARWRAELTIQRYGADFALPFDAFVTTLQTNSVYVPDFRSVAARGTLTGSPQVVSGVAGTNVITLSGFGSSDKPLLKAGDRIQTSPGRMHMVLADVTGNGQVAIAPALRVSAVAGPLVTSNCTVEMRCIAGWENPTRAPLLTTYRLTLVEQFTQT